MVTTALGAALTMAEAARRIPTRPHIATIRRWARKGVYGVRLKTFRAGRREFVTEADLERFLRECSVAQDESLAEASDSHREAEQALDALGVS